jgi:hypothetical protein
MYKIAVTKSKNGNTRVFEVVLTGEGHTSFHRVTLSESLYEELTQKNVGKRECVRGVFSFLLERESQQSILPAFDVSLVSNYFPEFIPTMQKRFRGSQEKEGGTFLNRTLWNPRTAIRKTFKSKKEE